MKTGLSGNPYDGSGGGITVTDGIDNDDNTNGITIVGDPTSPIVTDETSGETWAHEMAHGMGAGHGARDTDADGADDSWDPDGDGNYDTDADKGNVMWPFRSDRTGNGISEEQCKKLNEAAKKIGIGVLNADQTAASADGDSVIGKIFDFISDTIDESPLGDLADLIFGSVSSIEPFTNFTIEWNIKGIFPDVEIIDLDFMLGFDSDDNETTGISFGNVPGIDVVLDLWMEGGNFFDSNKWVSVYNYLTDVGGDISALITTGMRNESSSSYTDPVIITPTPVYSFVALTINTTDLGVVLPSMPAVMLFANGNLGSSDSANFTLHTQPVPTAGIAVDRMKIWSGYDLNIQGSGYSSNSLVTISFADMLLGTITTDSLGKFNTTMSIPSLDLGTYFLESLDENGLLAVQVLDVIVDPTPPTSDPTDPTSITNTTTTSLITSSFPQSSEITSEAGFIRFSFPIVGFLMIGLLIKHRRH